MDKKPFLSVVCATYNHEKYISQAIESFLIQKTNFPYEIVIGEDCSTDNTRKICLEYQRKYPDKIRLILQEKNVGAMKNHLNVIESCNSKYIANCEGDDYWTDPYKLQKQVDFLEANPEYSICSHGVEITYEGSDKKNTLWSRKWINKKEATIEDVILYGGAATCSLVYRNKIFNDFPEWFIKQRGGDWSLQILCTAKGKMKYLPEIMGIYRIHNKGAYLARTKEAIEKKVSINTYLYDNMNNMINALDKHFDFKYTKLFDKNRNNNNLDIFNRYLIDGDFKKGKKIAKKLFLNIKNYYFRDQIKIIIKTFIITFLPKKIAIKILKYQINKYKLTV